jgi:hypothetical protein
VLGSDVDAILANVITSVADNENLGSGNKTESLVSVGVTEGNDGGHTRGRCGGKTLSRGVYELSTLRVTGYNDLGRRAPGGSLH